MASVLTDEQREAVKEALAGTIMVLAGELREGESADERNALTTSALNAYNLFLTDSRMAEMEKLQADAESITDEVNDFSEKDDG